MSTETLPEQPDAEVIELRPPVPGPVPAYPEAGDIRRLPIIPPALQRGNIRGTLAQASALAWHRTRYHGLRIPAYLVVYLWLAVRGAAVLLARLLRWWHWREGWLLESLAVAAGRSGHHDAMRAHTEGKKTRTSRGRIVAACAAAVAAAMLALVTYTPWWAWLALAAVAVPVLARHGRRPGQQLVGPAVVAPKYEPPTPQVITRALASLGIAAINQVVTDGKGITFVSDVHRDGEGWSADLDLPHGVTARMILARREQLASGLRRPLSATWPEPVPAEHEGRLRLWIGFHDISKLKPATWPLARAGQVDVFSGFPYGTDPRQRPVTAPLFEHNWLIGAQPGQGKTSAVRVVAAAAALDPLAELWVHEHAGKGDLEPFARVAHRYVSGLDDEAIGYAAESLRMLRRELDTRSRKMKALPKDQRPDGKITREMAKARSAHLYPLVCIIDECQNVFMHERHGDQAKDDAAYVIRLGRAYGIILVLATQRPDASSLPTSISGNVSVRFCLKVPGQPENDMILGTSAYRNGYNAAGFRSGTDAGLGWLRAEGDPQIVRTYYLDLPACERIAERARAARGQAGTLTGYALGDTGSEAARSFAADVLAVFGDAPKLWTSTIAARLAEQFPAVYPDITAAAVGSQLRGLGVTVKNLREPGGQPSPGAERAAIEAVTP
jgi:S-DNA-T family DNA segregation ATPase FtsK/SpoIIIE